MAVTGHTIRSYWRFPAIPIRIDCPHVDEVSVGDVLVTDGWFSINHRQRGAIEAHIPSAVHRHNVPCRRSPNIRRAQSASGQGIRGFELVPARGIGRKRPVGIGVGIIGADLGVGAGLAVRALNLVARCAFNAVPYNLDGVSQVVRCLNIERR